MVTRTFEVFTDHRTAERQDREYHWSMSPAERLRIVEMLREINYGADRVTARLQRVLEVAERPRR